MPRHFDGEIDEELIKYYIVRGLNEIAAINRTEQQWPGRAKTCELAALWLDDLIARYKEQNQLLASLGMGRRRITSSDTGVAADEWLAAMERESDRLAEETEQQGVKVNALWRAGEPDHYLCRECGEPIEAGDHVGANRKGLIHVECADQPQQF
jgi:hypothetical protein